MPQGNQQTHHLRTAIGDDHRDVLPRTKDPGRDDGFSAEPSKTGTMDSREGQSGSGRWMPAPREQNPDAGFGEDRGTARCLAIERFAEALDPRENRFRFHRSGRWSLSDRRLTHLANGLFPSNSWTMSQLDQFESNSDSRRRWILQADLPTRGKSGEAVSRLSVEAMDPRSGCCRWRDAGISLGGRQRDKSGPEP
jgi:hypothetical protein